MTPLLPLLHWSHWDGMRLVFLRLGDASCGDTPIVFLLVVGLIGMVLGVMIQWLATRD